MVKQNKRPKPTTAAASRILKSKAGKTGPGNKAGGGTNNPDRIMDSAIKWSTGTKTFTPPGVMLEQSRTLKARKGLPNAKPRNQAAGISRKRYKF